MRVNLPRSKYAYPIEHLVLYSTQKRRAVRGFIITRLPMKIPNAAEGSAASPRLFAHTRGSSNILALGSALTLSIRCVISDNKIIRLGGGWK